jgi:quinol monooxygenase YgiN
LLPETRRSGSSPVRSAIYHLVLATEPDTLLYAPYHAEGLRYYMLEGYKDLAAREQHAKAPEVLALFPPVMATLASPIEVHAITTVCATSNSIASP